MKVGIVSERAILECVSNLSDCEKIVVLTAERLTADGFKEIIIAHLKDELFVPKIEALELRLTQLLPGFKKLVKEGSLIHFCQKDQVNSLTDQAYFDEVFRMALLEKTIIRQQAVSAIKLAKGKGAMVGRPAIEKEVIETIQHLHKFEKKSIREISVMCNVSIGTVFKYAKMADKHMENE